MILIKPDKIVGLRSIPANQGDPMHYKITLVNAGVPTEVTAPFSEASVKTITEGLDSLDVYVCWNLTDLADDPEYDVIKYTWPGPTSRLQVRRSDNDVMVFDGRVYAVTADRGEGEFSISAQS